MFAFGTSPTNTAYDVRGRQRDGNPKRFAVLSALKWILLASIRLIVKLVEFFLHHYDFPEEGRGVVPVTVSGSQSDCRAASLADSARTKTGVWVLTDQRFAFVEVRDQDQREAAPASTKEHLDLLKLHLGNLPDEWSADQGDRPLGPVKTVPVFELTADRYHDRGRDQMKPKGSKEGVFHLLEFPDGSSIALGIDSPLPHVRKTSSPHHKYKGR
ncbi:hypothetical protein [Glycomyces buryatensis]|uniref:hypothetical protein n=1 Tax=Glycomyces buryatensis TaxID=2570927 RepID=UPI0010A7A173|nr:hypothetical protein [Glycomyces buryatensis]